MALEYDPNWPGLTAENDASGSGVPELNRKEIKRIAGDLRKALEALSTPTQIQPRQSLNAQGEAGSLPGPPPGAGSLPDLRRECALGLTDTGEWPTASAFFRSTSMAFSMLIGDAGAGGLYQNVIEQSDSVADTLEETAKSYDGAEQANQSTAAQQA
ncbi:hypothetical protein [Microtetraspora niveoalba]|uniref:hypothetical protein n=1 Tax=Microtetraspora niveoalba TaxID=46175 RepID=UPI000830C16B|nr:hypothetical protein [Microtetraspora niveoalba]